MAYDRQILQILSDVGELGIGVQHLAKHVYNMNCTFFFQPDLEEIRNYVRKYMLRNSKSAQSLIERTERRGYYRLNKNSADARQLMLEFRNTRIQEVAEDKEEKPQTDFSLSLFD
jgi:hypothetical protein